MKRKNTQNAEKLTKDTRQYKHTPSKTKRVVGKIFALVGCFALLLSCVVVPSFADSYGQTGAINVKTPSPYFPSAISIPIYGGVDDELGYVTITPSLSFAEPYNTTTYSTSYAVPSGDYTVDTYSPQDTNTDGIAFQFVDFTSNLNNHELTSTSPLIFTYSPFYYNVSSAEYLPNNDSTNGNSFFIECDDNTDSLVAVYSISYSVDDGDTFVFEQLTANSGTAVIGINLLGLFQQLGIYSSSVYVKSLTVAVYDSGGAGYLDDFNIFVDTNIYQPSRPTTTIPEAIETVGLFDWIVEGIQGMLETPLIPIGNVSISIGSIVGLALGLFCVMAILKFFAGG